MAESPQRVDLRLTIPTAAMYSGLAGDIAARFAEYSGASTADAAELRRAVDHAVSHARGASIGSITYEVAVREEDLLVVLDAAGRVERITCPLAS